MVSFLQVSPPNRCMHFATPHHKCHRSHLSHSLWHHHPNNIWCSIHTTVNWSDVNWYNILQLFISVFNKLDAQNLFHNKFYFMPLHVSSTCAHQEFKTALHSLWYHHTYRWQSRQRDGHLYMWWYQRLCNAILTSWWWAHVLETCRGMK